ncbi:LysR substrate-binding domain-containing protein [Paracidovorax wautersii]|uniref:DNA-binding transcriptional LysR family regulator n=1 Tax=Paracidovorax wautersii TaxID=1177982 RepID=A0ABU1IFC7_9BURK|nr:LysR substrate-binding domain-containing protein [Paracidovorax wautersii]MDR6215921.1 DNA-binding transcriptional LysR family regulator [Paracidovorax wautersii]
MSKIDRVLRSNLKLRHLQLLVALDQFRHLGRASEFLSVTQPAVSKTLAEIERMFGQPLFERSTRGTEPTAAGASVVRFARSVLAGYERTRDEIAAQASGASGRTSVGAMVAATPVLLAQAVERLKARSRDTTVLIEEGDLTRLLPKLRLGELDLFVGRLEPGYASPDLETEALYADPMVAVVRPDHPLARKRRATWADLAAQPCVLPPPWASLRVKLEQQFFAHGLHPPADIVESASFLSQITFLHQRGAVAFMARTVARHWAAQGMLAVVRLPVPIELPPVGLITLRGQAITPVTAALVECLHEVAR